MKPLNGGIWVIILTGSNMSSQFFGNKLVPGNTVKGKSKVKGSSQGPKKVNQVKKAGRGK